MSGIVVVPGPDYLGAIMDHLRAFTGTGNALAFMGNDPLITADLDSHAAGDWGIVVADGGGPGSDPYIPYGNGILDIRWYGPNKRSANRLYRMGHAIIFPRDGRPSSFVRRDCAITVARMYAGPLSLTNPTDDSDFVLSRYVIRYTEVPVNVG
jgi:hypothetical protein